jgi:hypothetical protein
LLLVLVVAMLALLIYNQGRDATRRSEERALGAALGRRLIKAMLLQLNGSATYQFDAGTEFRALLGFAPLRRM